MTADTLWHEAPLVALDLEGTGAQDRDNEAILEIAIIPLAGGKPDIPGAYTTLIHPGRPVPRKPWISPGLTDATLADAPPLTQVRPELLARLEGKVVVGHNIGVDAKLLRQRVPGLRIAALIDTLRLARHIDPKAGNKLSELLDRHRLTDQVHQLATGSRPHRALWDTVGAALLLQALISVCSDSNQITFTQLRRIAGRPVDGKAPSKIKTASPAQQSLLDL